MHFLFIYTTFLPFICAIKYNLNKKKVDIRSGGIYLAFPKKRNTQNQEIMQQPWKGTWIREWMVVGMQSNK